MADDESTVLEADVAPDAGATDDAAPDTASTSSSFKDYLSDEGKIDASYIDKYAEYDPEVDKDALKKLFESNEFDLNRVTKQTMNLSKMLGKDKIPFPGENASDEDWKAFWEQAGAPKDGEDYKVSDANKEMFDEETLTGLLELGKQAKIPQKLMNQLVPVLGTALQKGRESEENTMQEQKREALQQIEGTFGAQGSPEFTRNIQLAQQGIKILAADNSIDDVQPLIKKYGNDAFLLQVFASKALESGEGEAIKVGGDGSGYAKSLDDQIAAANAKYYETGANSDLSAVMALREKKARFGGK